MLIPADVPNSYRSIYEQNYKSITQNTDRLMLFAGDQKIEHLNSDFIGSFIHPDANNPEHLFNIASKGRIGAFATQFGLISRYGIQYTDINYIVKLNSKTNLISTDYKDPLSNQLWQIDDVIRLKSNNSNLKIRGVGYTIYIGSEFEHIMLNQAAQIITHAHQYGLLAILWIYPRGKHINAEDNDLIPGSTGIANALGADFVKIQALSSENLPSYLNNLKIATLAAGNTKVICSGGESKPTESFLKELYEQIIIGGAKGNATGRNIFQRSLSDAVAFTHAISSIVYDDLNHEEALRLYQSKLS